MVATANARSECDNDMGGLNWIESSARNVLTLMAAAIVEKGVNKTCLRSFSSVNGLELKAKVRAKKRIETSTSSDQPNRPDRTCCEVFVGS